MCLMGTHEFNEIRNNYLPHNFAIRVLIHLKIQRDLTAVGNDFGISTKWICSLSFRTYNLIDTPNATYHQQTQLLLLMRLEQEVLNEFFQYTKNTALEY